MAITFEPKKKKFRKIFRVKPNLRVSKRTNLHERLNVVGLRVMEAGFLTSTHFLTIRQLITKYIKKVGKCIFYGFPNVFTTSKKGGGRMGKGKGVFNFWCFRARPGFLLCEIHTMFIKLSQQALRAAQSRLPIKTCVITKKYDD